MKKNVIARIDEELHHELKIKIAVEKISLQDLIEKWIKDYLKGDQDQKEPTTQKD